jgi:hypothetical protein
MKFQLIPDKGHGWDKLLSRNTKFIPKREQIPEHAVGVTMIYNASF